MCDYSLLIFPNRLAIESEQLLTYRFPSSSIGLASPADIASAACAKHASDPYGSWSSFLKNWLFPPEHGKDVSAVCIPPGARLRVRDIPARMQQEFGIGPVEDVMWTELNASVYEYRDAILFTNGRRALLQDLREGMCFEVLSLGTNESEPEYDMQRVERPNERTMYLRARGGFPTSWII
jgi:hypothetical protein